MLTAPTTPNALAADPALADRLEAMKEALGLRVIDAMYASNPFWEQRFGKRGRRHADQDAGYHLSYLGSALRIGSPSVMTEYARWLRGVLVSRGMCTRHLSENFARMREAIVAEGVPNAGAALDLLRAAERALIYADGPAARVDEVAASVARQTSLELSPEKRPNERREDDLRHHLSFIADALAAGIPERYADYVAFLAGAGAGATTAAGAASSDAARLVETLDALGAALEAALSADAAAAAACRSVVAAARARLEHVSANPGAKEGHA